MKNNDRGNILLTPLGWVYACLGARWFIAPRIGTINNTCSTVLDQDAEMIEDVIYVL